MELTEKQQRGLELAVARYNSRMAYTTIAGYAGTGKSTLVQFIISALGLVPDTDVAYIAYTGKAAQVLRNKNCPNSCTAHKLLYETRKDTEGNFIHIPRAQLPPYKLIVVDEVSMLPKFMWDRLLSHHIPVIALGDSFQLPPVSSEDNGVLQDPHIFLDEIMRQEKDSEIINLTTIIREGNDFGFQRGQEVKIVSDEELNNAAFLHWADQVICGKNRTRHALNQRMRIELDITKKEPQKGDKLICLHNYWDKINASGDALVNGMSGTITDIRWTKDNPFMSKTPIITFQPDTDDAAPFENLPLDYNMIMRHTTTADIRKATGRILPRRFEPFVFDFGYAITCHKAQGSEYDKVIVLEEYLHGQDQEMHRRWLYTAATRAAKQLIIVKNYHHKD